MLTVPLSVVGGGIVDCVSDSMGTSAYRFSNTRICVHARSIRSPEMWVALMDNDGPSHGAAGCIRTPGIVGMTAVLGSSSDVSRTIRFDTSSICYAIMYLR